MRIFDETATVMGKDVVWDVGSSESSLGGSKNRQENVENHLGIERTNPQDGSNQGEGTSYLLVPKDRLMSPKRKRPFRFIRLP